jgi:hypothetical protein
VSDQASTGSSGAAKGGASATADAAQEAEAAAKFTVDELKSKARALFNCSRHAVEGALALEKRGLWTVEEAGRKIEAFLKREVEPSEQSAAQGRGA